MVIFDHLGVSRAIPLHQTLLDFGNLGVRVFFVISGFIITTLLIKERDRTGTISLRGFYIRRAFRIIPIWLCFVAAIVFLLTRIHQPPALRDYLGVLTFNVDYLRPRAVDFSHLWSLSVEEKFYILWPLVMCFGSRRTAVFMATGAAIIVPMFRTAAWLSGSDYEGLLNPFHLSADAIAIGCLLALFRTTLSDSGLWQKLRRSPLVYALPLLIVGLAISKSVPAFYWPLGITLLNLAIATGIDVVVSLPDSLFGRVLNSRVFVTIGAWSYGLYLWQQPLTFHRKGGLVTAFPWNMVILLGMVAVGHYLIEKPAQTIGRKLAARAG